MTRSRPLVSVLVATYNGAAYLDETLRAIEEQTYRNLEVIVRDDGSTDESPQIAADYAARDPRFRLVAAGTRAGGFANYLALGKLAQGAYLKFCNQDDLLDKDCIRTLIGPLLRDPSISLATSVRRLIDGQGQELPARVYTMPLVSRHAVLPGDVVARHVVTTMNNQIGEPSTVLFRRRLVNPETMFDYAGVTYPINCDVALWLSLLSRGSMYYHAEPLSSFRIHGAQFSANATATLSGSLEWVDFLAGALSQDLLEPTDAMKAGTKIISVLHGLLGALLRNENPQAREFVGPIVEAMARAWRLSVGRGARADFAPRAESA